MVGGWDKLPYTVDHSIIRFKPALSEANAALGLDKSEQTIEWTTEVQLQECVVDLGRSINQDTKMLLL